MTNFSIAAVFSNHCVLQREKIIKIFGTAPKDEIVKISLFGSNGKLLAENQATALTPADSLNEQDFSWVVSLSPQKAQDGCSLCAECAGQKIEYTDISIGEVWLAGGQSNMEFELQNCTEGPEELSDTEGKTGGKNVRFYYTNKIAWKDKAFFEAEKNTSWQTWSSEWKKAWSAVGYLFAKKLSKELGVTVGVIGCNWGGTSASAWMRREYLESDKDLKTYLDEQEEATKGKSIEQQCREYDDYTVQNDEWQKKSAELYNTRPGIEWDEVQKLLGPCLWPGPKSCKNPYRPTGLYDCMLSRIIPYTIKGVIWYQGESDDHKPASYAKLFTRMIDNWRTDWNDQNLPFIFAQLPEHRYKQDKDFKHWCLIREAQEKVHHSVKNTFMTVAADAGEYNDIHPKAKKVLAERMTLTALGTVYKTIAEEKSLSPLYKAKLPVGNELKLYFENAPEGFIYKADNFELERYKELEAIQGNTLPEAFTGFEIAGADKSFYPAQYTFGKGSEANTITLSSPKVAEPLYARYAWYNYGPVTIFSKAGLPLGPFRTDTENAVKTEHAKIQQIMTVSGGN